MSALSITGTSGTVVPVDTAGVPVGDAVLYDDSRGADQIRALSEAGHGSRPFAALARAAWLHGAIPPLATSSLPTWWPPPSPVVCCPPTPRMR